MTKIVGTVGIAVALGQRRLRGSCDPPSAPLRLGQHVFGHGDAQTPAALERHALLQRLVGSLAQLVDETREHAGVTPELVHVALEVVDLFDDVDREDDFVVIELEDRPRVVQQDVGVQDVDLAHYGAKVARIAIQRGRRTCCCMRRRMLT